MQKLVVFLEPSEDASNISMKGGNMILNRFCIDEDAAFELSRVNYFHKFSHEVIRASVQTQKKGKGNEVILTI